MIAPPRGEATVCDTGKGNSARRHASFTYRRVFLINCYIHRSRWHGEQAPRHIAFVAFHRPASQTMTWAYALHDNLLSICNSKRRFRQNFQQGNNRVQSRNGHRKPVSRDIKSINGYKIWPVYKNDKVMALKGIC